LQQAFFQLRHGDVGGDRQGTLIMQKIDRNALTLAGIAGGSNKGGSSSTASTTSMVVVKASASVTTKPSRH
jgi:hypothetical protein